MNTPLRQSIARTGRPATAFASLIASVGIAAVAVSHYPSATALGDEPTRPTASASESNPAVPAAGHSLHGEAFNDGPRRRATIMPGMGKANFTVTTKSPEAQTFVNQGVAQLHSFFYFEAERSFRQAEQLDPNCVMSYWGMAMANVNNEGRARGFLKAGRKRDFARITPREKLYYEALEGFFQEGVDAKTRRRKLLDGLETIVQDFPRDLDARAWLAMVAWQNSGADGIGSRQAVDTVIDTVLQVEPMHPGAHHYRIHLWDGVKPIRAERSAALFAPSAPGIAHAWHMPGHTYTGLKRYADAAYQQEGSARVDHAYMRRERVMPFEIHNYAHNNQWLATTLSHLGRVRDAVAVARKLVEQPHDPNKNGPNDGGSPQRNGRVRWAEVLSRYELWQELLDTTNSGALDWSSNDLEKRLRVYYLALASHGLGDRAGFATQFKAFQLLADEARKPAGNRPGAGNRAASGSAPRSLDLAFESELEELSGYDAIDRNEVGEAFEHFKKARFMRPEVLARAYLATRNYGLAESAAKDAVAKNENQLSPLAAQIEILLASGKTDDARAAYRKLAPMLRQADADLPVLKRIAPRVADWKSDAVAATPRPTDDAAAARIDLTTLGPLEWLPFDAAPFALPDTTGENWSLAAHRGRNVLVLFFLGGKCAHCMQQLQEFGAQFEALKKLDTDVVAISTDDLAASKALKENKDGVKFPMPILSDPKLTLFQTYQAYDDFEKTPLHGTFLIDARGQVRFQRISADPFLDVEFIKTESSRVRKLAATPILSGTH